MTFIKDILVILKVKLWFATVNQYRLYKAKYNLWKYEQSLSPEQRAKAVAFRKSFEGKTPSQSARVLVDKIQNLNLAHHRLTERVETQSRQHGV